MERDLFLVCQPFFLVHFNSHAHVERDTFHAMLTRLKRISTHTLTWSVTSCFACSLTVPSISTHTLTWSVTSCFACSLTVPSISTHTLTWSVTLRVFISLSCFANFNSHAHVERDAPHRLSERKRLNFNSHAHVERDVLRNS